MYRGKIPHKWSRGRYSPEYMQQAPLAKNEPAEEGYSAQEPPEDEQVLQPVEQELELPEEEAAAELPDNEPEEKPFLPEEDEPEVEPSLPEDEPKEESSLPQEPGLELPEEEAEEEPPPEQLSEFELLKLKLPELKLPVLELHKNKPPQKKAPELAEEEPAELPLPEEPQEKPQPELAENFSAPEEASAKAPPYPPPAYTAAAAEQNRLISGKNAVLEALRSGQTVNRVLLAEGQKGSFVTEVIKKCRENGIPYQFLPKMRLDKIAGPDHRGAACELCALRYAEVEEMLEAARSQGEPPLLLLLDGVEDPHNLGAVMRTALCAGAHGIIIPKHRAAAFSATVAKTSAGASSYMPLARVTNLSQTARTLQQAGLWLAAADMDGQTAWQADLKGPLALVLGGEGKGISPLLKRHCDFCVSLPMSSPLGSLNISAAAAALLYEIRRQRQAQE